MLLADSLMVIGLATAALGTIQEADGVVERSFWLRNCGTDSVALVQGYTSCGCTTIHFAGGKAVGPGDSTSVALRFNPRGKGGEFMETGTIVYGDSRKRLQLSLAGTCITSEETLLRQFPVRVSDSLRLSANRFDLGVMRVGETKERGVAVLHTASGGYRIERIAIVFTADGDTPKGLQHIARPVKVGGQMVNIILDVVVK